MKKGDAAEHAEFHMKDNRWVPGWMCAPRPQTDTTERIETWLMPPDEQPHRPAGDGAAAREIP